MIPTKTTIKRIIYIKEGESVSTVLDKSHYSRILIIMPDEWDLADIRFSVSNSLTGTFNPLEYGSDGDEMVMAGKANVARSVDGILGKLIADSPFVKIRSMNKGLATAKNQTADRKFIIILSRW